MQITQINPRKFTNPTAEQKKSVQEKIKILRKQADKMVTGIFEFPDAPGGWIEFDYRFLPGEPITKVKITHGERISIPVLLAKHLNNTYKKVCTMPQDTFRKVSQSGLEVPPQYMRFSRTRFIQEDLMDDPMILEHSTLATA